MFIRKKFRRRLVIFLFSILLFSIVIIFMTRGTWNSYEGFGFAFQYPEKMKPKVYKGSTVQQGSIEAKEQGKVLRLHWVQGFSGEEAIAKEVLGPYLRSHAQGQKTNEFFMGHSKWIKTQNQRRLFARFYKTGNKHVLLNVAYAWHSEKSNRTFILCCGAPWRKSVILFDGTRYMPEWPNLRNDSSYSFCQRLLKSFEDGKNKEK